MNLLRGVNYSCYFIGKMSIIIYKYNFNKNCPLHQEMATSSGNGHIIKKWPHHKKTTFFDEVTFLDEFSFAGTFCTFYCIELDEVPCF